MDSIAKIEKFRQIKSSIKREPQNLLIGMDTSKNSSVCCFYNIVKGILLSKYRVKHNLEELQKLKEAIDKLKKENNCSEVIIGVEPTGNYHKAVCEYLRNKGYFVVYVSSVAAHNNRKTLSAGRWSKNDPRDAYNVVDLMMQGKIMFYQETNTDSSNIRKYLYLRQRLIKMKSAMINRIRSQIWCCHFPELEDIYPNVENPEVIKLLANCPTAEQIRMIGYKSFCKIFSLMKNNVRRNERLFEVWNRAQNSLGYPAQSSVTFEARLLARDLTLIKEDILKIDRELEKFCQTEDNYRRLLSIPGFGIFTTAVFKAIVGDINKFNHPRQIVKLAGIDLELAESGQFRGQAKVSKKGNYLLRYAISSAVNVAVSRNKQLKKLFLEKLQLSGNSRTAKAKLKIKFAEKLIRIIYILLKQNVPFNINYLNLPVREPVLTT